MINISEKIEEHKSKMNKITMTPKELSLELGIGLTKTYELIHVKGFPVVWNGNRAIILRSKVEGWIEDNIGICF